MTGRLLEFDPRPGGRYRVELRYATPGDGKTRTGTDVTAGQFLDQAGAPNQ